MSHQKVVSDRYNASNTLDLNIGDILEQGDVLLCKVTSLPQGLVPQEKDPDTVEYGEVTGHAHQLTGSFQILQTPDRSARYLVVNPGEPVMLSHEEHLPFTIPSGLYRIGRVVEFDPLEEIIRQVAD